MKIGFSSKDAGPSKWFYISHESKKGYYRSLVAGWDAFNHQYFVDLMEIDLLVIKPNGWRTEITFNWKYLFGFKWLRGV